MACSLKRLQVFRGRLAVLGVLRQLIRELLALIKIMHSGAFDRADVNEHVG